MAKKDSEKNVMALKQKPAEIKRIESTILSLRDERVILDSDLARLFGEKTGRLNEQVKRNAERFGQKYRFQLTKDEFDDLKSQSAISKKGRGGRTYLPWAYTEHGVVMAATVLSTPKAVEASKFIVDVFVEVRRRMEEVREYPLVPKTSTDPVPTPLERLSDYSGGIGARLETALRQVLDSVIDTKQKTTVREEAQNLISESIQHLKDRLKKQGLENAEIEARVTKYLAEAETEKTIAAKNKAETEQLEFATLVRKLRLLLEVQRAMEHDTLDELLIALKELGS